MDSDEEFLQFSESENQSVLVPERKLKRLRKATDKVSNDLPSPPSHDVTSAFEINSSVGEEIDGGELNSEHFEELSSRSGSQLEVTEQGIELGSGFENEGKGSGAQRHLDFDSLDEEIDGKGEDRFGTEVEEEGEHAKMNGERGVSDDFNGEGEERSGSDMEGSEELRTNGGSEKKRRNLDGFEGKGEKKRKKKVKEANDGFDGNLFSAASTKKERRERFKELRAESQRLLRETRDASFRPVPLVQKSVSSVLEKIRQRKNELSKKLVNMTDDSYSDGNNNVSRVVDLDFLVGDKEAHKDAEGTGEELTSVPVVVEASVEARGEQDSKETSNASDENVTSKMAMDDDWKQTFRAPVEDTEDIFFDSPESDSKDEIPSSPLDNVLAPSLAEMNLKLDSAPPDDISDDEEDNNKNNNPLWHGSADLTSSRNGDPAKAFLDDEAEEEDDSDGDHARFKDYDEDEDNMDSEELNDMIATAYEEKPIDNEMRNELHQKWLEQQDAVGTENLLQRLKCPSKQREMAFGGESEEEESEQGNEDESDNDLTEGLFPRNIVRMNLKKAKEMIPLMFTDKDDVYVSSDDEETEKTLVKRHFSHKTEEKSTFLSPAEDESSKGIFGLIKKLNDAPDVRKKGRISSNFNTSSLGGSKTLSSKSSFLSRGSRNSLPSFQKHSSSTVRSFVFERDDSNSRSAILTAVEESSDTVEIENRPKKAATAKFSYSQVRSSSQTTEGKAEKDHGPSLHEILRCPSINSSHRNGGSTAGQFNAIFAAFKLNQYPIKKEAGLSFRTA